MKKIILLIAIFFFCLQISNAQPGQLDPSFGGTGIVTTDFNNNIRYDSYGQQVLVQSDGSMYIIFWAGDRTIITRRFSNGSTDLNYGHNGFALAANISNGHAALLTDGKLIIAGSVFRNLGEDPDGEGDIIKSDLAVARFNTDGSLDNTFGTNGNVITKFESIYVSTPGNDYATVVAIQNDGKIVVGGYTYHDPNTDFAIARYNADGSPDNTFDQDGKQTLELTINDRVTSLAIQSDGKIVVTGTTDGSENIDESGGFHRDFIVARFNTNGSPDNTFNGDGRQYTDFGYDADATSLAILADGKIIVAGSAGLARLNSNGTPDNTFGSDGKQTTDFDIASIGIQSDGKIVTIGSAVLARFNTDGLPDNTFDGDGKLSTAGNGRSTVIQSDGKIVTAGYISINTNVDFTLTRYNINGGLDNTFNNDGTLVDHYTEGNTIYNNMAVQDDGKIVAVGSMWNGTDFDFALARYNTDGSLDNTFDGDGKRITDLGFNESATSVAIQNDKKIVVVGNSSDGNILTYFLARYNPDGTTDSTFDGDGKQAVLYPISIIKLQNDGKILVGGWNNLIRYNSNGTPDLSFNGTGRIVIFAQDFSLQSDGKIVVLGGGFSAVRYNTDGSLDHTFVTESPNFFPDFDPDISIFDTPNSGASSIAIQSDGKIVVGGFAGFYHRYEESYNNALVRFNTDGSLDHTFSEDGMQIVGFRTFSLNTSIALQTDDKIVVKGMLYDNIGRAPRQAKMIKAGFGFTRINNDGTLDTDFGIEGKVYAGTKDEIQNISIRNNKLYTVGYRNNVSRVGLLARYLLDQADMTFSCPSSKIVSTGKGKCDAIVNNIDPILQGGTTQINYTLSGATVASGAGSVSGKRFNKGVTTVIYSLANEASKKCSFTVTVNDKEVPLITNVVADQTSLWPANHKMQKVTITYDAKDNCGFKSPVLSVSGNQADNSDWIVIDNHHVQLRAEKGNRGTERIYKIAISVTDLSGNKSVETINVSVSKNKANPKLNAKNRSAIIEEEDVQGFVIKATPNPSRNYFTLFTKSNSDKLISVKVTDMLGRIVETRINIVANGKFQLGNNYRQGIYFVEVVQDKQCRLVKLMKE